MTAPDNNTPEDPEARNPADPPSVSGDTGNPGATPPAGSAGRYEALDDALSIVSPETAESGRSPSWKFKRIAFLAIGTVLTALIGMFAGPWADLSFTQERADREEAATDAIDARKPPFNWKIVSALEKDEGWSAFHLDRYLTPGERATLRATRGDEEKIWEIVRPLGARRVGGRAEGYLVQFTSERAQPVSITKLSAKPKRCKESEVKTVISTQGAGAISWGKIHFYFKDGAKADEAVPAMEEVLPGESIESASQWNNVIALGNGESPGYFKLWPRSKLTCEWSLIAEYNVNSGKTRKLSIGEDEDGQSLLAVGDNPQEGVDYMGLNEFEETGTGTY